jgi:uncharacterized protein (UPF0332 family)
MDGVEQIFLEKAQECLIGAVSEHANGRYNNCANRCYYACFQAAIAALIHAGIRPRAQSGEWGHAFVQGEFAGTLIYRRKLYTPALRDVLPRSYELRQKADYGQDVVTEAQASRVLRRTQQLVEAIR